MLLELAQLLIKQVTAGATGSRIKQVRCQTCGFIYYYRMARYATGAAHRLGFTSRGLDERAQTDAQQNLEDLLRDQSEYVPCPLCGGAQPDMVAEVAESGGRWLLWGAGLIPLLSVTGVGVAALVNYAERDDGRGYANPLPVYIQITAWSVAIGVALFYFRRIINGRYHLRVLAKGLRRQPSGTPPALIEIAAGVRDDVIALAAAQEPVVEVDQRGWLTFCTLRALPEVCCVCEQPRTVPLRLPLSRPPEIPVTCCPSCVRRARRRWWRWAAVCMVPPVAVTAILADRALDIWDHGYLLPLIVLCWVVSLIAVAVLPQMIVRPYRFEMRDRRRQVGRIRFRSSSYTKRTAAYLREQMSYDQIEVAAEAPVEAGDRPEAFAPGDSAGR